jgi:hypothetical protein
MEVTLGAAPSSDMWNAARPGTAATVRSDATLVAIRLREHVGTTPGIRLASTDSSHDARCFRMRSRYR